MGNQLFLVGALCVSLFSSCIDEDINRDPLLPTKEDQKRDGVIYGSYLPSMQKSVIPIGSLTEGTEQINRYQIGVNLAGDAWAGYMSPRDNKFNGGNNFTTYFMYENWVNYVYGFMVTDVYTPWMQIKRMSQDEGVKNDEIFALAQIIKIAALHRTTDMFGPIPYSQVGKGSFKVAYDSQEAVYRSFLKELDEAITVLTAYSNISNRLLPNFDIVYEGDVNKWIRFANSLMLRLSIRVRYADSALAKAYAEKAVKHEKGLIESDAQAAKMGKGVGLQMRNPLKMIKEEYNDTRMGATIYSYLVGYNDPRAEVYFEKGEEFKAIRSGIASSGSRYETCSKPKVKDEDPLYWMKASEVCFLKAEGALAGFEMGGTAETFYNEGIRMSFKENGVSNAETYLNNIANKPANFTDGFNGSLSATAPSSITIKWDNAANEEQKLERIITQKYLAIFPNGHEAWTEWRRTGYPKQIVIVENRTNAGALIGNGFDQGGVRRMTYPLKEYEQNKENLQNAINKDLGGLDKASVNLWWDKKNK
ncbi:RagB/SusD family nutrient uptake outer membrane protein [Macellibacteroides fermentans]|uniref:SusD/RagB family nutrient-binding outer membrane lipoprotein n=1 Tax=Macellibacteroides fermentans TaxID=879969 RepID=A0A8E2A521_9PORP|nr:RagB/SusD family nutrient uptake outer membrane protein [Macellibacteroides fermentans]NYI49046.1 hypothetical protein [Macellibacteroides fermentans]